MTKSKRKQEDKLGVVRRRKQDYAAESHHRLQFTITAFAVEKCLLCGPFVLLTEPTALPLLFLTPTHQSGRP